VPPPPFSASYGSGAGLPPQISHEKTAPSRQSLQKRHQCPIKTLSANCEKSQAEIPSMKILVCVKQVPDSSDALLIDERTGLLSYTEDAAFRMNRFDEFALEEALLIKEKLPGSLVDTLSVGPERANAPCSGLWAWGRTMASISSVRPTATGAPSRLHLLIAACIHERNYDLIMTGVMAEDTMASQTGQLIAALLDLPCATSVIEEEVRRERGRSRWKEKSKQETEKWCS